MLGNCVATWSCAATKAHWHRLQHRRHLHAQKHSTRAVSIFARGASGREVGAFAGSSVGRPPRRPGLKRGLPRSVSAAGLLCLAQPMGWAAETANVAADGGHACRGRRDDRPACSGRMPALRPSRGAPLRRQLRMPRTHRRRAQSPGVQGRPRGVLRHGGFVGGSKHGNFCSTKNMIRVAIVHCAVGQVPSSRVRPHMRLK